MSTIRLSKQTAAKQNQMKFIRNWMYARNNGYNGDFNEYIALQYNSYCEICFRCKIEPMSKSDWENFKVDTSSKQA